MTYSVPSLSCPMRLFCNFRDELLNYLRPFAQEGRVVREEDVREFFETKTQAAKGEETNSVLM